MKKAKRLVAFLNLFPQVPGRVWVDLYSAIALVKFGMGKPVDVAVLGLVLGIYAVSKGAKAYAPAQEGNGND